MEFKPSCNVIMAKHLGVDRRIVKVIMDRVSEAGQQSVSNPSAINI